MSKETEIENNNNNVDDGNQSESDASSPNSSAEIDGSSPDPNNEANPTNPDDSTLSSTPRNAKQSKSKSGNSASSASKPRLTPTQKNTNHKDAENKRRNAIRERFTDLSKMVPGAEGQERSEQVMLGKTTEFLRAMLEEQRRLEKVAESRGVGIEDSKKLKETDLGGKNWRPTNIEGYEASKVKRGGMGD